MIWEYLIAAVITLGIAWSLANSDGFFGWFVKFRLFVKNRYGEESWVTHGFECPICVGFWVGMPVAYFTGVGVIGWLFSFGFVTMVMSLSPD